MIDAANTAGLDLAEAAPAPPGALPPDPRPASCSAFLGHRLVARGELDRILPAIRAAQDFDPEARLLVFEDGTSGIVELDLRQPPPAPRAAGRPKLGVVAREVTLLPRHWEWLNRQPGGASVALRRLVDEARKSHDGRDRVRQAQEVTYRFLLALGGDLPGYEEALRALFAGRRDRFTQLLATWPADIRDHALRAAAQAFPIAV